MKVTMVSPWGLGIGESWECLRRVEAVRNFIQRVVGSNSKYTNYLMNQPCNPEHAINGVLPVSLQMFLLSIA